MIKKTTVLFIVFSFMMQNIVFAKDWGLSFQQKEAQPVGNETSDYLKDFDAYFVGDKEKKYIYLTFDAGYENGYTEKILDTLNKNKVEATFFLVGGYIEKNPEIVKRMVKEGHLVGNHTISHPDMSKIEDLEKYKAELEKVEQIYKSVTGKRMKKFYRPPEGKYSEQSLKYAKELGYKTIFWSLAHRDFDVKNQPSREQALEKLVPRIHPGAIILLHNMSSINAEILEELICEYRDMGYEFKSLDEL